MIGLKRGTVQLCEHEKEWEIEAQNTIARLKEILGDVTLLLLFLPLLIHRYTALSH